MTVTTKLRFGLIGAGGIAQSYAEAFSACRDVELVGVADVKLPAAQALGHAFHCRSFGSHEELLAQLSLDAVVVCTPPATHADISICCLERGLHVLCEKPVSLNRASAIAMMDAARRAGVKFTMASKFRYVSDVIKAKAIVTSGILGDIILFENAFTSRVDMSGRWNSNRDISGGGVLIDNGTHSVDLMRYFLGPLAQVQVVEGKRNQGLQVEETVRIFVTSATGVLGSIDLSWSINKELPSYINIYGTHGTVWVGWRESKYRQSGGTDWIVFGSGYDKLGAFRNQIDNFAAAIRGEEVLLITPEDALASVEVIEACYADLQRSHWIPIKKPQLRARVPHDRARSAS